MRKRTIVTMLAIILGIAAIGMGALYYLTFVPPPGFATPRTISIARGESVRSVAPRLKREGIIQSCLIFLLYAEVSRTARRIQPGDYAFKGGETMAQVMRHLVNGDFLVVTVTIPEGLTLHQIAERLGAAGLVCQPEFEAYARDGNLIYQLGMEPLGAEGYMFPATYRFSPHANSREILAGMLQRFFAIMTPDAQEQMFRAGLTMREMVTLASIIEKEAKVPGERRIIASVFLNRLRLGMPLQSDPTAEYDFDGEDQSAVAAVHEASAFNTYSFTGLPPGPIANPGMPSIEAALYPAKTDFLYFVARDNGTHIFSRTYAEHQRAIAMLKHRVSAAASAAVPSHHSRKRPHAY